MTTSWALSGSGRNGIRVARRSTATTLTSEQGATTLKIQRTEPALGRKDVWIGEIDSVELRIASDLNADLVKHMEKRRGNAIITAGRDETNVELVCQFVDLPHITKFK